MKQKQYLEDFVRELNEFIGDEKLVEASKMLRYSISTMTSPVKKDFGRKNLQMVKQKYIERMNEILSEAFDTEINN